MDFGEPAPDIIARLYNEIKEKKVCRSMKIFFDGLMCSFFVDS